MPRRRFDPDPETGPTTLGSSLRAGVWLVAWCNKCLYRTDADVAALVAHLGPDPPVLGWGKRLRCSHCGSRDCDFVVTEDGGMPREEQR
jgi:hypothetical protein